MDSQSPLSLAAVLVCVHFVVPNENIIHGIVGSLVHREASCNSNNVDHSRVVDSVLILGFYQMGSKDALR